ncbi:MAG: hypothetical protein ACTSU2_08505 [Promethearchaeota archaeon]
MKSMHFCTEKMLDHIYNMKKGDIFSSIRTGWIPGYYINDIIRITRRFVKNEKDPLITEAKVIGVEPLKFKEIERNEFTEEEINIYHRKFNPEHYFFKITFQKI